MKKKSKDTFYQITSSTWRDRAMQQVTRQAQGTFCVCASQADRSAAGVVAVGLEYLASIAHNCTPDDVRSDLEELHKAGVIKYDPRVQEMFIVGYVTKAGSWRSLSGIDAIERGARGMRSDVLRTWLRKELAEIPWEEVNPTEIATGPNAGRRLCDVAVERARDIIDYLDEETAYLFPDPKDQAPTEAPTQAPTEAPSQGGMVSRSHITNQKSPITHHTSDITDQTSPITVVRSSADGGCVQSDELSTGDATADQVDQISGEVLTVDGWGKRQQRDDDQQSADKVTSADGQPLTTIVDGRKVGPAEMRQRIRKAKSLDTLKGLSDKYWQPIIGNSRELMQLYSIRYHELEEAAS